MTKRRTYMPSCRKENGLRLFHCNQQPLFCLHHHLQMKNQRKEDKKKRKSLTLRSKIKKTKDIMTRSNGTSCSTPKMDDTSEELEDKEPELSADSSDQKMQAKKESDANIKDLDMVHKENEHPMDLITVPLSVKSIGSSERESIIAMGSQEDPSID
eukprot:TRINITY_DN14822_c0_g2_i3.p1 TRINITY_DN14822_c0_g2~~TRINITY_DN14822_c0_g2_i3.p1  ORF type:complete len:156 (-),score=31.06 TRINITY_DN14822_c0_g2_i3:1268-1735(-)